MTQVIIYFCTTLVSLNFHQALISREISRRANENYKEIWWAIKRRTEHCRNLDVMCSTLQQTRRMEHHSFFIVNVFSRSKRWTEHAAISIFLWTWCAIWCLSRSPDVQHDVTRMRCLQSQLQTCQKRHTFWIEFQAPCQNKVLFLLFRLLFHSWPVSAIMIIYTGHRLISQRLCRHIFMMISAGGWRGSLPSHRICSMFIWSLRFTKRDTRYWWLNSLADLH